MPTVRLSLRYVEHFVASTITVEVKMKVIGFL